MHWEAALYDGGFAPGGRRTPGATPWFLSLRAEHEMEWSAPPPAAFVPAVAVLPVLPVAGHPLRASPRRAYPAPRVPLVVPPDPAPVPTNPHKPRSRSYAVCFHAERGRRSSRVTVVSTDATAHYDKRGQDGSKQQCSFPHFYLLMSRTRRRTVAFPQSFAGESFRPTRWRRNYPGTKILLPGVAPPSTLSSSSSRKRRDASPGTRAARRQASIAAARLAEMP